MVLSLAFGGTFQRRATAEAPAEDPRTWRPSDQEGGISVLGGCREPALDLQKPPWKSELISVAQRPLP